MCGIAGYFGKGNRDALSEMTKTLHHRGPDDEGFFVDKNVGLGHKRLSIIDLSLAGHQPMSNENDTVWLVFNGEIYNFKDLREELKGRHNFKSNTDTEVIIHLYEEIGERVFEKLNGMFAIAIYDKRKSKIILARDRMGKKPLYYSLLGNNLIFASEVKAILKYPLFKKELDLKVLNKYLMYEYVPTPDSIFKNIKKLEPANFLVFDGQKEKINKFWNIKFNNGTCDFKLDNAVKELDKKFNLAVKRRLISDAPLGIFLSGGIDSSAIAYYAQRNSNKKIKTFSIGFKESSFDESNYARQVAKYLGTDHSEEILDSKKCLEIIPKIASQLDEPIADSSILPTYLLSNFASSKVKVVLGGDGGDELFCGYDTFIAHKMVEFYDKIPLFVRKKIIEKIISYLPTSHKNISFDFKAKSFIKGFYGKREYRDIRWMGSFDRKERENLFHNSMWSNISQDNEYIEIDNYLSMLDSNDYFNQLILLYLRMYMMDDILVKVDRASMMNSIEVRTPLLDYELVEFANKLPLKYKINGFKTKYILRKLMEGKLPLEIIKRKKKGFGMPIASWISGDLKTMILDYLSEDVIKKQGLFNHIYINKLLSDHFSKRKDNRKKIWTLFMFQLWHYKWLKN
ncbi:asparagine synthase (glutamine-hydrolyzing) [Candidatus Parcubacteria bacterium]|nr:asparagine synthase (glutamine-hydrolyzing) [Candidatus Parcubacteria bacterium]